MTSESALHALQELHAAPFDLIVSDLAMPGLNGAEFLVTARQLWPETRRILLTAHFSADLLHDLHLIADAVMDKLLSPELICEKICRHARNRRTLP